MAVMQDSNSKLQTALNLAFLEERATSLAQYGNLTIATPKDRILACKLSGICRRLGYKVRELNDGSMLYIYQSAELRLSKLIETLHQQRQKQIALARQQLADELKTICQ